MSLEIFLEPKELKNSIEIQKGSIVSKALKQKKEGSLSLFAFDEGQALSEHTAPYDAFIYVFEGEAEIKVGERENIVKEGQAIALPKDIPHSVKAKKPFKMLLFMIKG
ncbi:MAG: cupin domain-containing protein [Thermoanaerobaculia bacterium]